MLKRCQEHNKVQAKEKMAEPVDERKEGEVVLHDPEGSWSTGVLEEVGGRK